MSKQTHESKYYPQFDGLRFIAALAVVCYHWIPAFHQTEYTIYLNGAISFFFVLSSFLITRILFSTQKKHHTLGVSKTTLYLIFIMHRTVRIFPPYYFYLLFLLVFTYYGNEVRDNAFSYFAYLSNYNMFNRQVFPETTAHLWALAVEEQFYLLWPLVILFVPFRHLVKAFVAIIVASAILRVIFFEPGMFPPQGILTQYCMGAFAIGGLLTYLQAAEEKEKRRINKVFNICLAIIVPLAILFVVLQNEYYAFITTHLAFPMASMRIIEVAIKGYKGFVGRFLENKIVVELGKISYGIYVYHLFVPILFWKGYAVIRSFAIATWPVFYKTHHQSIWKIEKLLASTPASFVLYAVTLIIIATASNYLIEKPFNKLKIPYPIKKQTNDS